MTFLKPLMISLSGGRFYGLQNEFNPLGIAQELVRIGEDGMLETGNLGEWRDRIQGRGYRIHGSGKTGDALLIMEMSRNQFARRALLMEGLIHVNVYGDMTEQADTMWVISSKTGKPEPMSIDQVEAICAPFMEDSSKPIVSPEDGYKMIRDVQVSPDGRYAVVLVDGEEQPTALLVRMSDMASVPVEGVVFDITNQYQYGGHMFSWSEAGILVTAGDGGLYQIQ